MILVSTVRSAPLALLRLSTRMRLTLIVSTLVPTLTLLWIVFPAPPLDFLRADSHSSLPVGSSAGEVVCSVWEQSL